MNFYRIPKEFYSWATEQKNPVVIISVFNSITNRANWNYGKWKDGVETYKGEARITISEIARELNLPRATIYDAIKKLEKAGFIKRIKQERGKNGFISIFEVCWLSQPDSQNALNPTVKSDFPDSQPDSQPTTTKTKKDNKQRDIAKTQPDSQPDSQSEFSRQSNQAQPDIRRIRNIIEEKEILEEKEGGGNNSAASEKSESDFEEKKEKLKKLREEVKEEIELKAERKEFTAKELDETVLAIYEAFAKEYEARFGAPPVLSGNEFKLFRKRLVENPACKTSSHLKNFKERIISGIPNYFKLQDPWVAKQGYSFFAFIYRLNSVVPQRPSLLKCDRKQYLKALGVL